MTRGATDQRPWWREAERAMMGRDCYVGPLAVAGMRRPRWKAGRPRDEGRQWTSENWAENSCGPKKERKRVFIFRKHYREKQKNLEIAR
jgi:hypothetical protein